MLVAAHAVSLGIHQQRREEEARQRLLCPKTHRTPKMWDLRGEESKKQLSGPCICYKLLALTLTEKATD